MEETYTTSQPSKLPLILLGAGFVLTLITTFTFYFNWRDTEEQLKAALLANTAYEKDSFRVSNLITKNKGDREVIADGAYKAVVLRGTGKSPNALAVAYYNAGTRELFLDVSRLPEPEPGQQYQVWAMNGAAATDAGTLSFEKMNEGMLKMNPVSDAKSVIITLEKAGGASSPTTSATYLSGQL